MQLPALAAALIVSPVFREELVESGKANVEFVAYAYMVSARLIATGTAKRA